MDKSILESTYEVGLPEYLQKDLDAYKEGLKNAGSIFSLDFDIEKKGKIKMSLIFSTKNWS